MSLQPGVRGYKSRIVMDFEESFRTEKTTEAGVIMPFNSESLRGNQNKTTPNTIRGRRESVRPFADTLDVSGNITVPIDVINFGYWLKSVFGSPTTTVNAGTWEPETEVEEGTVIHPGEGENYFECTTAGTTGTTEPTWTTSEGDTVSDGTVVWTDLGSTYEQYVHVFKIGDVQPSMVLERRYANPSSVLSYAKYNGVKTSTMGITAQGSGELVAELGLMGATEEFGDTAYDSSPTEETFLRFQQFQASIKEGGSAITGTITQAGINLNTGLQGDLYTIGDQGVRGDIPEGIFSIEGSITAIFRNTTKALLEKAIANEESSLEVSFTLDSNTSLSIEIPELEFARQAPAIDGPQGVTIQLPWNGYYDDGSGDSGVIATLKNNKDSY